jgi:hypothetical protein
MTIQHEQVKLMAIAIANLIVESIKSEGEERYSRPGQATSGYCQLEDAMMIAR